MLQCIAARRHDAFHDMQLNTLVALLSGAQSWAALADELKPVNCAAGAAAAAALALAGLI